MTLRKKTEIVCDEDETECNAKISVSGESKEAYTCAYLQGWSRYKEKDFCFEHRRNEPEDVDDD